MTDIEARTAGMDLPCSRCGQNTRSGGHTLCLWCEVEALRGQDILLRRERDEARGRQCRGACCELAASEAALRVEVKELTRERDEYQALVRKGGLTSIHGAWIDQGGCYTSLMRVLDRELCLIHDAEKDDQAIVVEAIQRLAGRVVDAKMDLTHVKSQLGECLSLDMDGAIPTETFLDRVVSELRRLQHSQAEVKRLVGVIAGLADGAHERGETCHACRGAALFEEKS